MVFFMVWQLLHYKNKIDVIIPYALPIVLVALCVGYYFYNPLQGGFSLPCPWKLITNTQCPACGMQRALHALVHGHWLQAWRYNYFFVLSVPYALLAVLCTWYNVGHVFDGIRSVLFRRYTLWVYVILFCIWWVVRNLLGI